MDASPPAFDPKLLTEHSEWVRTLARSLMRDPGAADDIAQETWAATLRRPPAADRPARAWLGAIARNVARQRVRGEERRARRERRAARPEALPSDEQLAERVALQRWVVQHVMALEEPYRRTILLRFFEGLPPRAIAARMGVPVETVKSRTGRALARLRERLGSDGGPGGASGVHALLPIVAPGPWDAGSGGGLVVMGKKSLLLIVALVMVSVLYVVYLGADSAPAPGAFVSSGEARSSAVEDLPEAAEVAPVASSATETPEPRTPAPTGADPFALRTIEADSGLPLAGIQVWFAPWAEIRGRSQRGGNGESFDIEAVLAESGAGALSDEHGRVHPPRREDYSVAVARSGELFGYVHFAPESGTVVDIPLRLDRSVTIQAVTAAGVPVSGVPVGLAQSDPERMGDLFWWALTTGAEGQVTVPHVDQVLGREIEPEGMWTATLASPWPNPPAVHLDPRNLPAAPVQLVVGAGGRVVVRLENERGELQGDPTVILTEVGADRDAVGRIARPRRHIVWARGGLAVFENVAPGLELRVTVSPREYRSSEKVFAGPARAGDEVVARLCLCERYPMLSGTLVDAQGSAVAGRMVNATAFVTETGGDARGVDEGFRTDALGRFERRIATRHAGDIVREVLLTTDEAYEGESLSARVELRDPRAGADIDLGRVTLEPPRVILTGRVVDAAGQPIHWAGISVKRMAEPGVAGPPYEWVTAWQTNTQKDGSFQLTGDQGPGDYRLDVAKTDYLRSGDVPFQPGTRDLEIVLRENGGLQGSLNLPAEVPASWLRVTVRGDEARRGFGQGSVRPNPDGSFFVLDLAPGDVDVTVFLPAWREPLARITGVRVEGGGPRVDPRLELDLTDAIHRIDLELRDPEGAAIRIGCVAYPHPGGSRSQIAFDAGAAALLAPTPTIDAEVLAPGFRPRRIEGAHDGMRIVLERGIPVRVKLPEDFELPAPPATLSLELTPVGLEGLDRDEFVYADDGTLSSRWGRGSYGVAVLLGDTGEHTLAVGSEGLWEVDWRLAAGRFSAGASNASGYPDRIEVDAAGPVDVIVLSPDAGDVERAISRFD